ncbi:MAG: stage II sporulation protein M [Candidatus Aenigmarchaeota archaeon]|nr:stage II sporulation protein M [Candidatus Aenigmarchaeota archaeon]
MVLEALISPCTLRRHPSEAIIQGAAGTAVAIFVCQILAQSGLFLTMLITLALLPSVIIQIRHDEKQSENQEFWKYCYEGGFLSRHGALILDYIFLILGISVTIACSYLIIPDQTASMIYSDQVRVIGEITGNVTRPDLFSMILVNNLGVMAICFVFSLFYASGAIFLIAWNATVLGVVVGQGAKALAGFHAIPLVLLSYAPHGSFEFLGYILAAIAGGILSVAVTRHKESREHFRFILKDAVLLTVLAVAMLIIGAYIEAYPILM